MYIQVRLLKGFPQPLLYQVPDELCNQPLIGSVVRVPIQKRIAQALVINQLRHAPNANFTIKKIEAIEALPNDAHYLTFIKRLAYYYQTDALHYIKRIHQFISQKPQSDTEHIADDAHQPTAITLTPEQQTVVDAIKPHISTPSYVPTLMHGVTGSGKTEVYKKLLEHTFAQGKTSVLMLPEVTLALQFERLLRAQLPAEIPLASFHSSSSPKQKRLVWQRLLDNTPQIIIGVHVPILLPLPNLGLIIIDEEHEAGYQEKKHPKTNSKEAALMRAQMHNIPILLGSATPSISSLYNVKQRGWQFFQLKKRFAGNFPTIKLVDLSDKKDRRSFWISQELYYAIKDRLAKKEQTILFLNRRGHSFFVQCKACAYLFACRHCSVSLTLHAHDQLTCHYCGYERILPPECPGCKAPAKDFMKKGIGTQQLVSIVQKLFPTARIARADLDTSSKKKEWHVTVEQFQRNEIDIMIGTQTITKGYDFDHVTLVGIIWADLNLHFPKYNATETTLQQLIQVAGRAGRKKETSEVIVQSMSDHPAFDHLEEAGYINFYRQEKEIRSQVGYPPCKRLVEIELKHVDEITVAREADRLAQQLMQIIEAQQADLMLLGPTKPPIAKIKNTHARTIYLKADSMQALYAVYTKIQLDRYKSSVFFTPNPL